MSQPNPINRPAQPPVPLERHLGIVSVIFVCLLIIGGYALWTTDNLGAPPSTTGQRLSP
jgi:hypothetical protein